jgi:hypothetical protein
MIKRSTSLRLFLFLFIFSACTDGGNQNPPTDETLQLSIEQISGLEDVGIIQNKYFDPLKDIGVINQLGANISYMFEVEG